MLKDRQAEGQNVGKGIISYMWMLRGAEGDVVFFLSMDQNHSTVHIAFLVENV